ncbi:hypothetical protein [Burkholderia sp. JKS000303]|uniref:hypothetical protein n=1 Tax=Burkholderia sp. JKS000303 TaxID=1938747 RepID=UPI000BF9F370|nr:hypothetical protein [Burkholderia sp. JKS000303]PFH27048.1 hypothetical protein BX604_0763 [Burkholderia sp. JKS000303]
MSSFATRVACLALFAASAAAHAAPVDHAGRGIYHFASQSGCPFASATATDCNRVALDAPDVHASVDTDTHTIVFSSDAARRTKDVLGDVLLQGTGVDGDGQRVPLSVHVLLRRDGVKWDRDVYVHAPVHGQFTEVRIDPYRVRVKEGGGERDVLTPDETSALFAHPSFASRLAQHLVKVRATDPKQPADDDITIALGVGKLTKSVARASFTSNGPRDGDIAGALASGTWAIRLDVLSDHIPVWVAQRELFLFGLDGSPLVKTLRERGFAKNDRIELGARDGNGYLRVNGHEEAFAGAAASAHAFLQESFVGLILGWHRDPAAASAAASAVAPKVARSTPGMPA